MTNLIKHEQTSLTPIKAALNSPLLREQSEEDVFKYIKARITIEYSYIGQGVHEDDLLAMTMHVIQTLKKVPNLRIDEIPIIFRDVSDKKYGEYFPMISAASLSNGILQHYKSLIRNESILQAREAQKKPDLTDQQKEDIAVQEYENCLKMYKKTGVVEDAGNGIYNWLDRKGLIKHSDVVKWEIYREAESVYMNELQEKRDLAAKQLKSLDVKKIDIEIANLMASDVHNKVVPIAKRLALKKYFDEL